MAVKSIHLQLPKEDYSFEKVSSVIPEKLTKGEFETTAEFELRKKSQLGRKIQSVTVEGRVSYNADLQLYELDSYCPYGNKAEQTLKDNSSYEAKSGTNGFGAKWEWMEYGGTIHKLTWNCSNYDLVKIQIPLETARSIGDKMVARLKIDIPPQEWKFSRDYTAPKFGNSISRDLTIYSVTGTIDKVFLGDSSNSKVYSVYNL